MDPFSKRKDAMLFANRRPTVEFDSIEKEIAESDYNLFFNKANLYAVFDEARKISRLEE